MIRVRIMKIQFDYGTCDENEIFHGLKASSFDVQFRLCSCNWLQTEPLAVLGYGEATQLG